MNTPVQSYISGLSSTSPRHTLVENQLSFAIDQAELHLFETMQPAERFELQFDSPVIASMISGKKVMHLAKASPFEFVPGESVILRPGEKMEIDFPDASMVNATRCLALTMHPDQLQNTLDMLNEHHPKTEARDEWLFDYDHYHLMHDRSINETLTRLIYIFTEKNKAWKIFASNALQELLIRLMQTQARNLLINDYKKYESSNRLAYAIRYIQDNLHQPISIEKLCDKACMSKPHFFRSFKNEFGITPVEFINQQRIMYAKQLLSMPIRSITDACYSAGFNSLNYFVRVFKKMEGITPSDYKKIVLQKLKNEKS
jgi:AraC-like DNA-binding protein